MPLAAVASGQQAQSSQLNQLINLLTGVMNDQPVTLKGDNTRAPALLTLDSVNAGQVVREVLSDAGTAKWGVQKGADNSFAVYDYVATANALQKTSLGALAIDGAAPTTNVIPKKLYAPTKAGVYEQTIMLGTLGWLSGDSNAPGAGYLGYNIGYDVAAGAWKFLTSGTGWLLGASGSGAGTVDYVGWSAAYGAAGTGATINERFRAYGGGGFLLQGAGSGSGSTGAALQFAAANPYILSNGSYIVIPNGLYISGGTFYAQNQMAARGGIVNDQGTYLGLNTTPTQPTTPAGNAAGTMPVKLYDGTGLTSGVTVTIPSGIRSVRIYISVVGGTDVAIRFNGDTGANYDYVFVFTNNAGQLDPGLAPAYNGTTYIRVGYGGGTYGCVTTVDIPDVKGAAGTLRSLTAMQFRSDDATTGYLFDMYGGHWRSTSAITSITVTSASGSWTSGMVTMWGFP